MTNQLTKPEPKFIEYAPFGAADKIKLSVEIVKRFVCIATKSGRTCDDAQATKFMMLCQTQRLNPFAGDCFLAGYDGKNGPVFSMITAHVAFLKRAETSADYEGMESGVILVDSDGKLTEREGDFVLPDENCVGGWARVYRKGRKPTYRRLSIAAMKPNYETPFWSDAKSPGQIVKCAEADALRATFPTLLGGLYNPGESANGQTIDVTVSTAEEIKPAKLVSRASPESSDRLVDGNSTETSQHDILAELVVSAGHSFDDFEKFVVAEGIAPEVKGVPGFADLKIETVKRLIRAKTGLLKGMEAMKAGAQ